VYNGVNEGKERPEEERMKKKLILLAAPPACGKNYVSELIGSRLPNIVYLDKDNLGKLLRRSFALCGEPVNMDGAFYLQNLRAEEYETLMDLAFSALRFSDKVLLNAPFLREVRDVDYMRGLKASAAALGAELILVWVVASPAACYARMKARNASRDVHKLADWDEYLQKTDRTIPEELARCAAVDCLFPFDNEDESAAAASLEQFLKTIGEIPS
jgi:predicted kinase